MDASARYVRKGVLSAKRIIVEEGSAIVAAAKGSWVTLLFVCLFVVCCLFVCCMLLVCCLFVACMLLVCCLCVACLLLLLLLLWMQFFSFCVFYFYIFIVVNRCASCMRVIDMISSSAIV
jgi:hypothetical protein